MSEARTFWYLGIATAVGILLVLALLVASLGYSVTWSTARLKDEYVTEETKAYLKDALYKKGDEFGARCQLLDKSRSFHICDMFPHTDDYHTVSIGRTPSGDYRISVSTPYSSYRPMFTYSEEALRAEKHLPDLHFALQDWMRTLVPEDAIAEAYRSVLGHDFEQPF